MPYIIRMKDRVVSDVYVRHVELMECYPRFLLGDSVKSGACLPKYSKQKLDRRRHEKYHVLDIFTLPPFMFIMARDPNQQKKCLEKACAISFWERPHFKNSQKMVNLD